MEFFIIYLLMILGNIQGFLIALSFGFGFIGGGACLSMLLESDGPLRWHKWFVAISIVCAFLASIIPSKEEMAIIAAAGVTYNVVTSDTAKELGGKTAILLNKKLDEMLTEEKK